MSRDTGPARLPSIPSYRGEDSSLGAILGAMKEWIEVRGGARGNAAERVVTQRELDQVRAVTDKLAEPKKPGVGEVLIEAGGLKLLFPVERFGDLIKATKLYQDLSKRLDDPSRFDDLRGEVREELLRSIAEEASRRGAQVLRTEKLIENLGVSMALRMEEVTAAADQAAAGARETLFATAEVNRAQAGKVTQLEASLGNFYQDGSPGRASLEASMQTTADRVEGLRAQYTLKVQAGGALAGFGLAAEEIDGAPTSSFIVRADKFAIVSPDYNGGLQNTPDASTVPFGVDADGIYFNSNVYVKGQMRVDTGGRTLIQGLRGSLMTTLPGSAWSDTAARQAIWARLGNAGSAANSNHLVIGDTVTVAVPGGAGSITRVWSGAAWIDPGVMFSGSVVVDGSLAATKVDTRGLTIKDAAGNVIFSSGVPLDRTRVSGLGAFASLNAITAGNVGTYIAGGAIGNAYIGDFIQSWNYVPGSTGWTIQKSGFAEFDMVRMRRRETVATGTVDFGSSAASGGMVAMYNTSTSFAGGKGWPTGTDYTAVGAKTINLPAIDTGIDDVAMRNVSGQQPYGAAIFDETSTLRNMAFLSSSGAVVAVKPDAQFDLSFAWRVGVQTRYNGYGSKTYSNSRVFIFPVVNVRNPKNYIARFSIPVLRWVLYRQ